MKEELRKLFEELINDYEDSEQTVINDRGDSSDYAWLEERIQEYRDRFDKIIQKEESIESKIIRLASKSIMGDIIQICFNVCHLTDDMKSSKFWRTYKDNKNLIVGVMKINGKYVYVLCGTKTKKNKIYFRTSKAKFIECDLKEL